MIGVVAAVLASAGATAVLAPAPARWVSPRDLSGKGADSVIPDVAVDSKGTVIVVWAQAKDSNWTIEEVERPPGGPWSTPRALSVPADHVASPQLAIGGGTVDVVWNRYDGKNLIVQAASRDAKTRSWSAPTSLSKPGRDAQAPRIAVNSRGDAVAVWASVGFTGWTIQAASRSAGGPWQSAVPLDTPQAGTAAPDVVVDDTGRAVAVWAATAGAGWRVQSASRTADGTWSKVVAISGPDATGSIAPQVALEGSNDVLAVWSRTIGNSTMIEAATLGAGKTAWSPAAPLFAVANDALAPSVTVNARGDGVIIWTSSDQTGVSVQASYRRAGKAWGPPQPLSGTAAGTLSPRAALDARGDAVAVWTQTINGFSRVHAASFDHAGRAWSAARVLSKAGADSIPPVQVALDGGGDGVVAWSRYDGQSFVVQASGYDGSGPALAKLTVPTAGKAGKRLVFKVAPKDVWTTVGAIRWSFGDGTAGSGRTTGHVYARPGTYTLKITASDAFGHATSLKRVLTISAA